MSKLIPTALERQKIFYHLKKCSSYTAWNRVLGYYKTWADLFEKSVIEAEDKAAVDGEKAEIGTQKLILVLKRYSTCEKCVDLLRQGNKSPFRYDGLLCFAVAERSLDSWGEHAMHYEDGDIAFSPDRVPHWEQIEAARRQLGGAWGEIADFVLQTPDPRDAAVFKFDEYDHEFYFGGKTFVHPNGTRYPPYHFPPTLPEVPDPQEVVLVKFGEVVPVSGIYEPINVPAPKRRMLSLLKPPPITGPFEVVGAMNYLHGDSTAPHIGEGRNPIPTTWRLLWKDDRYLDGTIPSEEAGYVFNEPRAITTASVATVPVANDLVYARSGERTSKAGTWAVQDDLQGRVDFALDEVLPLHQGREVTWVWTQ